MRNKQDGSALALGDGFHLADGFLLELGIANGEDFVHHEDLGFEESGYGKAKTDSHTGRVAFDRGVYIAFAAGEIDDLVQFGLDLITGHTEDGAVHEDVLPTRHLTVKTGSDFQERTYSTVGTDSAGGGACDAGEEFEQCALAGTILTDDTDDVTLLDLEIDVTECPDIVRGALGGTIVSLTYLQVRVFLMEDVGDPEAADVVTQGLGGDQAQAVLLAYMIELNRC